MGVGRSFPERFRCMTINRHRDQTLLKQDVEESRDVRLALFREMILTLENSGRCMYDYHTLGEVLFPGESFD